MSESTPHLQNRVSTQTDLASARGRHSASHTAPKTPAKRDRPETIRQAQTHDTNARKYVAAGFCVGCAGQAAWGHQQGFSTVMQACTDCIDLAPPVDLVSTFRDRWLRESRMTEPRQLEMAA